MGGVFINDFTVRCALGRGKDAVGIALASADVQPRLTRATLIDGRETLTARLADLPEADGAGSRANDLVGSLVADLGDAIAAAKARYGAGRVAFVLGGSNSGIEEGTRDLKAKLAAGAWPDRFRYDRQEMIAPCAFGAAAAGVGGPAYAISTACTSGAKALATGARMIEAGLADAVVCGGADALCDLTLNGFAALESLAQDVCNPFSANRCGITIGEGGALFVLSREPGPWRLEGFGESSDAHHASAPDPTGAGAEIAVSRALAGATIAAGGIGFVHAHGTATRLNDQMEAGLIHRLFGDNTPCASTKPLTGHTLGAAGAVQAALCLLAMERDVLPPLLWDGERDPELPAVRFSTPGESAKVERMLSLSFAFGGSNMALVLGRG
jgi:3-oxoacyl-[acyl-carrier-protein] synthase I